MKNISILSVVSSFIIILMIGRHVEAQYSHKNYVFASAGTFAGNSSFEMCGTLGQPVVEESGNGTFNISAGFWYGDIWTDVNEDFLKLPSKYELLNNYPNPFNPTTIIKYSIPKSGFVAIEIINILGENIATLVNEYKTQGFYKVEFNSFNLSSGIYFYRIHTGNFVDVKKMILLR
ncbi:MAG: T9SS type A sorting domain-containing protein [Bacteroidota bacterium]